MTSRNPVAYNIAEITRDQGFTGATVHIHPANWTSRRRNIILRALRDGMSTAGDKTSDFITQLTRAYGSTVINATLNRMIPLDAIRDDKQEAMLAYTAAWIKIKLSKEDERLRWQLPILCDLPLDKTRGSRGNYNRVSTPKTIAARTRSVHQGVPQGRRGLNSHSTGRQDRSR